MSSELEKRKAEAYDCMVQIENWQRKLREINDKIIAETQTTKVEDVK